MSVSTAQLSQAIDADIYICDTGGKIICCKDIWQSNLVMYMGECIVHSKYTVPETALSKLSSGGYTETGTLGGMYKSSHFISVEPIVASGKLCGAVIASQDTDSLHEPVRAMLKMFLFSAILALAIAFVATYVMTYQMTKPCARCRRRQSSMQRAISATESRCPIIKCWAAMRTRSRSL